MTELDNVMLSKFEKSNIKFEYHDITCDIWIIKLTVWLQSWVQNSVVHRDVEDCSEELVSLLP